MSRVDGAALEGVLDEQIRCAEAMLATLARENRALMAGDAQALNAAGADKARLVDALESLERERLALAGLQTESGGGAAGKWQTLLDKIEACRERNLSNGGLAQARREQVLAALRLLRGAELELYDAAGSRPAAGRARALGSA